MNCNKNTNTNTCYYSFIIAKELIEKNFILNKDEKNLNLFMEISSEKNLYSKILAQFLEVPNRTITFNAYIKLFLSDLMVDRIIDIHNEKYPYNRKKSLFNCRKTFFHWIADIRLVWRTYIITKTITPSTTLKSARDYYF